MKFTCQRSDLSSAIQNASKALSARPSIAILEGIHLIAEERCLKLTCSDGSLYIRSEVPADVLETGSVVVDARLFSDIIRHFPEGTVSVNMDEKRLISIKGIGSRSTITGQSDGNYPAMSRLFETAGIHVPQSILKNMIGHVLFAIAVGEVREALNGGYFEISKNELRLVGLDGFKLSIQKFQDNFVLPEGRDTLSCIIPAKVLAEVAYMCADSEEPLTIHIESSQIMFVIANNIIVSSLYAGSFINYQSLLPKSWETRVVVRKDKIQGAVERAGLIARSLNSNIVKLSIGEGKLMITSRSEVGDVYEEMDVEIDGKPVEIAFNGKYLSEVIKNVDEDIAEIFINDPLAPCVMSSRGDENHTYLLMSVRI